MAYTIFQGGSTLYAMDQRGSTVSLSLPTGCTLDDRLPARFVVFGNYAVMVNSPNRPLAIDANLNVRYLCPNAPTSAVTLSGVTSGSLSGTYAVRQTYCVLDAYGRLIAESDFGPTSDPATIAAKLLRVSTIPLSPETITLSRFYRTTTGESVFFEWIDQDGNTQTSLEDDLSDADLSVFSAPNLGTPPDLVLVGEHNSRLFGVSRADLNSIYYSEPGLMYAWPSDNILPIPRVGSDSRGVTALMRRRDAMGVGRTNGIYTIQGSGDETLSLTNLTENCGVESQESVAIFRDVAFFCWKDGVYVWDSNGLRCVSDFKVSRWFSENSTFNLDRLQYSFAHIDTHRKVYRLFLATAGSTIENCWIEYDFVNDKWWGPHTSTAMLPTSAFLMSTDGGRWIPLIGARDGYCRQDRELRTDDTDTPIDFDVVTSRHDMGDSDSQKYFGELSLQIQSQHRGTLQVQTAVGDTAARRHPSSVSEAPMQAARVRVGRCGEGQMLKLRFRNVEPGVDVNLRGYVVDPVNRVGRR